MRPSPIHKLHLKLYPSSTSGRRGYLASEPDNAKGESDFVALVFRTGWVFEVLGIMIAGMGCRRFSLRCCCFHIYFLLRVRLMALTDLTDGLAACISKFRVG